MPVMPSPEMPDPFTCRVALSLRNTEWKTWTREAVYDVQMGDKTVIRRVAS